MHKYHLSTFTRGWIVGDFTPSIIQTKDFEFMVRSYDAGDVDAAHVHKVAHEITVVVSGVFSMNDDVLHAGDIIHLAPGDPASFTCIENGTIAVIKSPSVIGDKYPV